MYFLDETKLPFYADIRKFFTKYLSILVISSSYPSLRSVASVEVAIVDGFGDVVGLNLLASFKVGDGAGNLQDAAVGSGGEREAFHCCVEQFEAVVVGLGIFVNHVLGHLRVEIYSLVVAETFLLYLACLYHSFAYNRAWLALPCAGYFLERYWSYFDLKVYTVEDFRDQ